MNDTNDFDALAEAAELDPANADFAALRQVYVQSDAYRPLKHILQSKLMQITDNVSDFNEVAATCQNILAANPLDLEARMLLAFTLDRLGDGRAAERNHAFAERLLDSILETGDGKSFESAFVLVAEAEAWTVLRTFGIQANEQTRHRRDDGVFDVFEGILDEEAVTVYFDVTTPVAVLDETLEHEKTDNEP